MPKKLSPAQERALRHLKERLAWRTIGDHATPNNGWWSAYSLGELPSTLEALAKQGLIERREEYLVGRAKSFIQYRAKGD